MRANRKPQGIPARTSCPSHPDAGSDRFDDHEPLAAEMRCAYCGELLAPEQCGACGKFRARCGYRVSDLRRAVLG